MMTHIIEPTIPTPSEDDVRFVGGGFLEVSLPILSYLIQSAGLRPDSTVLDVGCGVGRVAYALAHYLGPGGRYEGFDIVDHLVEWARQEISTRFPRFNFTKVDVYNKHYNPAGVLSSSDFRFPHGDGTFDVVFLTSVFTHMLAPDVRHYLDEIRRVLRPGGRCFFTCFLLNEESRGLIREGKARLNLVHPLEECFTSNPGVPEWGIGYEEDRLFGWVAERGLAIAGKDYGSWCGRTRYFRNHDFIICKKIPE